MMQKSVAYILVAVVVGYMLVSAVPNQIAMYATPQQTLSMEAGEASTVELTGSGFSDSVEPNASVEMYWDDMGNTSSFNLTGDHEVWFDVPNATSSHGGPWNGTVTVEGRGFSGDSVEDLGEEVADLALALENVSGEFEIAKSDVGDVSEEAIKAAEAASEAVSSVASTANSASQASADAAEAASAARNAASGLKSLWMASWWIFDILIALGVYFFARQRFS